MKKVLSLIFAVIMMAGCFSWSAMADTETDDTARDIKDYLVVAYDFEGESQLVQLADKATAGEVNDDLTATGTVTVKDGVATVASGGSSCMTSKVSSTSDLSSLTEYTVYMKMKATGLYGSQWFSVMTAPGVFRTYYNGPANDADEEGTLACAATITTGSAKKNHPGISIQKNEWVYVAYTATVANNTATVHTYSSTDGVEYTSASSSYSNFTASVSSSNVITLAETNANDTSKALECSFDDILIFNKALTAAEIATLDSLQYGVKDKYKNDLVVAYDFEGKTQETQLADKASAGNVNDKLTVATGGTVTVENGVATIAKDTASKLTASATNDLKELSGYTIYMKVKATGDYNSEWVNLLDMSSFFKGYINSKDNNSYTLNGRTLSSPSYATTVTFAEDAWFYVAYTATVTDGKLAYKTYVSTDGNNYTAAFEKTVSYTAATTISIGGNITIGGKSDESIELSYDDIMIFKRELGAAEVASLSSIAVSDDRLGYVGVQTGNEQMNDNDELTAYDIRFVSVIDSLGYDSIGYDIVVTADGTEQASVPHACTTVYSNITELGFNRTAEELGGKYIFALGFKNFDTVSGTVVFKVTPYYTVGAQKTPLTSVEITYVDGEYSSSNFVY